MNGQVDIRKAIMEDVPAIVEIWKELMDFHKGLDAFFSRSATGHERFAEFLTSNMEKEDSCVLVAADGVNLVGYCQATISNYPPVLVRKKYVEIFDMAVTEKYQRQGIGRMIIDALCRWYADKDVDRIELKYLTANKSAEEFWKKMGFKPYLKTAFLVI
jgi:ribosomal protein S18 acetylase RimI-like enzyme